MDEEYNPFDVDDWEEEEDKTEQKRAFTHGNDLCSKEKNISITAANTEVIDSVIVSTDTTFLNQSSLTASSKENSQKLLLEEKTEETFMSAPVSKGNGQHDTLKLLSTVSKKLASSDQGGDDADILEHHVELLDDEIETVNLKNKKKNTRGRKRVTVTEEGYVSLGRPSYLPPRKSTKKMSKSKNDQSEKSSSRHSDDLNSNEISFDYKDKSDGGCDGGGGGDGSGSDGGTSSNHVRDPLSSKPSRLKGSGKSEEAIKKSTLHNDSSTKTLETKQEQLSQNTKKEIDNAAHKRIIVSTSKKESDKQRLKEGGKSQLLKSKDNPPVAPPRGYLVRWSESRKRWYWFHKQSKTSQWEEPTLR